MSLANLLAPLGSMTLEDLMATREALRREPLSQDSEARIGLINAFLSNFPEGVIDPDQLRTSNEALLVICVC